MVCITGPSVVDSGLVLHLDVANPRSYPGTGTAWSDLSGNGNSGTLVNSTGYNSANGGSLVFDSVNDYSRISSSSITNLTNNFSTEIWYKTNNNNPRLWYSRYPQGGFMIGNNGGNTFWKITKYAVIDIYAGSVPQDSNWHQVACIFSSSGSFIYVDGILNGSSAENSNVSVPTAGYIDIGVSEFGYHNGNVSLTRVYNRVLSAVEIKQNFEATRGRYNV